TTVEPLHRVPDDNVKTKLGHLIAQHRPTSERVKQVVNAVRKARSQSARLQVVKKLEKDLAEEAHSAKQKPTNGEPQSRVPARPRRDRFVKYMARLADFLDMGMSGEGFASFRDFQIASEADKKVIASSWKRIQMRMKLILRG
ncbi:unnamed protein product, partial [marine sediment metagenome]